MADELTIKVSAKLDESSVSGIQSQLDSIGKNKKDGIKLQLDKTITTQINTLKKNLEQMSSRVYPIKIQIDQTAISNIQNLTDSLNKAVANVQSSVSRQVTNVNSGLLKNGYTGVSKVIQRGKVDEINGFEATSEIEKRNLALGETLTIYKELKKEQDEEFGRLEETSRQYETNYELQAKEAAKAYDQQIKEEARYRSYIEKENEKAQREQEAATKKQQQEQARIQKGRDQKSSMYAGMFQQIEKEEQKERDRVTKEEQKRQDDYTKLHIQARQKQAKEDERLAKEEQKRQNDYDKLFAEAERRRIQQEADAKKASEQSYLSDLKKNSKQLEFEQKTTANAQNLIANAQNELELLKKSTFSGSKALTGDYAERARAEIEKVSGEFEKLKEAAGKSFSDAMNVSKDGLTASLKNLSAELDRLKGLEYPADKLAAKDVDTLKLDYGNKIQEFRDQLKGAGLETSNFATKLGNLEKSLQTVGKVDGSGTVWADWKAQFESLQASYEKFQASASGKGLKLAESIDIKQLNQIQDLIATLNNSTISGAGTEALKEELYSLETEYSNLMTQLQSGNLTTDQFNALSNGVKELDDRLKQAASSAKVLQDGFKNEQSIHKFQNNVEGLRNNFEKLERTYASIIEKNPEIAAKFEQLRVMFEQGQIDPINYAQVASDVSSLGKACSNAAGEASGLRGALEGAFGGVGQYLARFTSAFYIINKSIQTIKSMVNEVTQLDTSLMELQKVTSLSGDSLAQFTDNAFKTGKEVGRTGKDVIDAVTTFSRAGYNLQESNELAKAALTMTNVGVDIPNTEAAASDMISILKAFDKQADESMQVIDKLYNVANKEPLDFGNITEMLVTAGGTLAQTNTSLEESMGLLTGGFATLRNSSVANGLIQISQRLRGVREDGEAIEEEGFMPKLKKAFGDAGVAIEDQNGELRSTYDILHDLAGQWDTLSSKQRQYLGEKAAGTRQVKVLNAIMANWDVVEDTIQKANEATGEATKGNEKYLDSIEGRITQFKSAFSDLARTTIDSGIVKGIVSIGTTILNITKSLGGLVPILTTLGGLIVVFSGAKIASGLSAIGTGIKNLIPGLTGMIAAVKSGTSAWAAFQAVLATPAGMIGGALALIGIITSVVSIVGSLKKSTAEQAASANQNYQTQKTKVEDLNTELKNTQDLMSDLSGRPLTVVEQDEYDRLKKTNDELQRQIDLENTRLKIAEREAREASSKTGKEYNEAPQYIEETTAFRYLGPEFTARALNKDSSIDSYESIINTPISNEKMFEYQTKALIEAKKEYQQAEQEFVSTDRADTNKLEELEQKMEDSDKVVQDARSWINDYLSKLEELTDGISRVENPTNERDKYYNHLLDLKDEASDTLLFSSMIDESKGKQAEYILGKYSEEAIKARETIKEKGQITSDDLVADGTFDNIISEFEKYGWSIDEVATHLTEFYKEQGKIKEFPSTTEELIKNNYLASESYKALTEAMAEQEKAGAITAETFKKITADKELAKYLQDTEGALRITANGLELNTDAMQDYIEIQNGKDRIEALALMQKDIALLEETQKAMQGLNDENELAQKLDESNALQNEITALQAYVSQLDNATSALERYQNAKKTSNQDAAFNVGQNAYKDIKEGRKTGKTGTDDFKDAVGFILGPNWEEDLEKRFPKGVEQAYSEAEKLSQRYFGQKDERTGMTNFMKDLSKATDEEGRKLAEFNAKTGEFQLGVKANGESYSLEEIGNALGIYEEAVSSLFGLMETYDYDVEYEPFVSPEDQKAIDEYNAKIEAQEQSVEKLKNTQKEADDELAAAQEKYNANMTEENRKELESAEERKKAADEALEQEQNQLDAMKEGNAKPVDTMPIQEALQLFQQLQGYIDQGIPINVTPGGQYEEVKSFLESLGVIEPVDVEVNAQDNASETLDGVTTAAGEVPTETETKTNVVGDAATELGEVATAANEIPTSKETKIDAPGADATKEKISGVAKEIQDIASGEHNATIFVKTSGADTTDTEINNIANKERTATIKVKYSTENDDVGDLTEDQIYDGGIVNDANLTAEQLERWQNKQRAEGKEWSTLPLIAQPLQAEVDVELSGESGKNVVEQLQQDISGEQFEFNPDLKVDDWNLFSDESDNTVGIKTEAENPEEPIEQVQQAADNNPLQLTWKDVTNASNAADALINKAEANGVGDYEGGQAAIDDLRQAYQELNKAMNQASNVEVGDAAGAESAATALQTAASQFTTAYNNLSSINSVLSIDPIEVDADTTNALQKVSDVGKNGVTIDVNGNTSPLASAIESFNNRTITVNIQTNEIGGNAKGTRNADPGLSLVDEKGAELIEHTRRGTYELGTNNGPRLTNLEAGDVVHTASETKRILSRLSAVGGFFRDGLNQAKSILTGGAFAGGSKRVKAGGKNSALGKSSNKKKSSKKKSSSKSSKANTKKLQEWFEKLFDWAEIRLERLQTITDEWIYKAGQAIGYAAQNTQLANAMKSVENQIKDTTAAYNLYIAQADKVAKKTKLSADIINRIQNGTIEISSYDKNTQQKIQFYKEWLNFSCHFE